MKELLSVGILNSFLNFAADRYENMPRLPGLDKRPSFQRAGPTPWLNLWTDSWQPESVTGMCAAFPPREMYWIVTKHHSQVLQALHRGKGALCSIHLKAYFLGTPTGYHAGIDNCISLRRRMPSHVPPSPQNPWLNFLRVERDQKEGLDTGSGERCSRNTGTSCVYPRLEHRDKPQTAQWM